MKKLKIGLTEKGDLNDIEVDGVSLYELLPNIYAVDAGPSRYNLSDDEMDELMDGCLGNEFGRIVQLYIAWDRRDIDVEVER